MVQQPQITRISIICDYPAKYGAYFLTLRFSRSLTDLFLIDQESGVAELAGDRCSVGRELAGDSFVIFEAGIDGNSKDNVNGLVTGSSDFLGKTFKSLPNIHFCDMMVSSSIAT